MTKPLDLDAIEADIERTKSLVSYITKYDPTKLALQDVFRDVSNVANHVPALIKEVEALRAERDALSGKAWSAVRRLLEGDFDHHYDAAVHATRFEVASSHLDECARIIVEGLEAATLKTEQEAG